MKIAFLVFLLAYIVHAVISNLRTPKGEKPKPSRVAMFFLQTPLICLAGMIAYHEGIFNRSLVSLPAFAGGVVLGHGVFAISLLATHRVPRDVWDLTRDIQGLLGFLKECPELIARFTGVSLSEELIYRVAAQTILIGLFGRPALMILLVAVGFALVHKHFFENPLIQSAEFFAFSVLLGALYCATGSLLLVLVVHTVRNLESVYIDYLGQLETYGGDAGQALAALMTDYHKRSAPPHTAS